VWAEPCVRVLATFVFAIGACQAETNGHGIAKLDLRKYGYQFVDRIPWRTIRKWHS